MNPTPLPAATAALWAKLEALDLDGAAALSVALFGVAELRALGMALWPTT